MATSQRMPQPSSEERPRFVDRPPERFNDPKLNPYLIGHREFGPPLLTATQAATYYGRWHEAFGRHAPLHVEIGAGNGFFLAGFAQKHPEINLLGIEIRYKRTVLCARKIRNAGLSNALITRYDAWFLDDLFEPGSLSGLYINHPDPWPKDKHEKNRLISRWFLEEAAIFLREGATLRLKSDFEDNVARVPRLLDADGDGAPMPALPFQITGRCEDVTQGEGLWPDDIETNYQSKFRKRGLPVYAIELTRTGQAWPPEGWVSKHAR